MVRKVSLAYHEWLSSSARSSRSAGGSPPRERSRILPRLAPGTISTSSSRIGLIVSRGLRSIGRVVDLQHLAVGVDLARLDARLEVERGGVAAGVAHRVERPEQLGGQACARAQHVVAAAGGGVEALAEPGHPGRGDRAHAASTRGAISGVTKIPSVRPSMPVGGTPRRNSSLSLAEAPAAVAAGLAAELLEPGPGLVAGGGGILERAQLADALLDGRGGSGGGCGGRHGE